MSWQKDWLILCVLFGHKWSALWKGAPQYCERCLVDRSRKQP